MWESEWHTKSLNANLVPLSTRWRRLVDSPYHLLLADIAVLVSIEEHKSLCNLIKGGFEVRKSDGRFLQQGHLRLRLTSLHELVYSSSINKNLELMK